MQSRLLLRGAASVVGSLTPITLFGSNNSVDNSAVSLPASTQAGDLAVMIDVARDSSAVLPTDVVPSGFTGIDELNILGTTGTRMRTSFKILAGGESSITGMDSIADDKVILVFRGGLSIGTATAGSLGKEATNNNPIAQVVAGSGQTTPLVIVGASYNFAAGGAFTGVSPAFDATVGSGSGNRLVTGYKIYNSSPADVSVDMADLGFANLLMSFRILLT